MNRLKSEQASADDAAAQALEKCQQKLKEIEISDHRRFYEKKLGEACGFATGLVAQDTECELSPPLQDNISKWVAALPDLVKTKVGGKNWLNISTQKQRTVARIQTVSQQHVKSTSHRPTATSTAQADDKAAKTALPKPETQGKGGDSGSQTLGQNDSSKRSSQQVADAAADQIPADGVKALVSQTAPQTRARTAAPVAITNEATPQPSQRLQKTVIPSTPVGPPSSQDSFQSIDDILPQGEVVPMENGAAVLEKQRETFENPERKKWKTSKEKARKLSQNAASTLVPADANANGVGAASNATRPGPTSVAAAGNRRTPVEISVAAGTQKGGDGDLQQNVEPAAEVHSHEQSGRRAEKAAVTNSTRGSASEQVNKRQASETVDLTTNDSDAQAAVGSKHQTQHSQTVEPSASEQQNKAEHVRPDVQSQGSEATPPKQVGLARKRSAAAERLVQMRNSSRSAQPPKRKATTQSPQGTQPKPSKKPKAKKNQDIATLLQSQQKRSNPPASQSEVSDPEPPPVTTPNQGPSRWGETLDRMAREPPLNPRKRFLDPQEVRERRPPVTPPQPAKSQHPAAAAAHQDSARSTGSTVYAYEPNVQELEEAETRASTELRRRTQRQLANLGASPPPAAGSKGPKKSVVDLTA
ncbi:hypothetical protein KC352_g21326 [Hortaea werneckii]|nr:hypothetical protein KC352_g21326 [Hortaea werneckii]